MLDNIKNIDLATMPTWVWGAAIVIGIIILVIVLKALKTVIWPIKIVLSLLSTLFTIGIFIFLLYTMGVIDSHDINQYLPDSGLEEYTKKIDSGIKDLTHK